MKEESRSAQTSPPSVRKGGRLRSPEREIGGGSDAERGAARAREASGGGSGGSFHLGERAAVPLFRLLRVSGLREVGGLREPNYATWATGLKNTEASGTVGIFMLAARALFASVAISCTGESPFCSVREDSAQK